MRNALAAATAALSILSADCATSNPRGAVLDSKKVVPAVAQTQAETRGAFSGVGSNDDCFVVSGGYVLCRGSALQEQREEEERIAREKLDREIMQIFNGALTATVSDATADCIK